MQCDCQVIINPNAWISRTNIASKILLVFKTLVLKLYHEYNVGTYINIFFTSHVKTALSILYYEHYYLTYTYLNIGS